MKPRKFEYIIRDTAAILNADLEMLQEDSWRSIARLNLKGKEGAVTVENYNKNGEPRL